jgi:hypothetical protein
MKRTSLLLLLPALLLSTACERHSASSLPSHGAHVTAAEHGVESHAAAPEHAPAHAPAAPEKASSEATPAPKFFQ